ncbi:hypothetical protein [Aeromonas hydrophila]|uniref:Uncharacterized protein n=1 Tax=Aeromonas hydrophila TaxID=644 RepID=A0AAX3P1D2_AERHY|nr:hypothetical protein [Aeromonas hydrophila]WEE25217.1 hypothetical protein PY771_16340 [Aeromonas hydrophila]
MNNLTAEQAIRKVANSLINTHRPQLGACHSTAIEASLEALAELADELSLLDIYAELTKRLDILRGGCRPHIIGVDMAAPVHDVTVIFQPPFADAHELLAALEEIAGCDPFHQSSAGAIARAAITKAKGVAA